MIRGILKNFVSNIDNGVTPEIAFLGLDIMFEGSTRFDWLVTISLVLWTFKSSDLVAFI